MTAREIAVKLNLSPASVSLALNNKPGISEKTRKRVLDEARASGMLGIREEIARRTIVFLEYTRNGPHGNNSYFLQIFSAVIEGVEQQAKAKNCDLRVITANSQNYQTVIEQLKEEQISGLLVLATEMREEQAEQLAALHIPTVIMDNYFQNIDLSCVTFNNEQAVDMAVQYLVEKGHRRIGYVHVDGNASNFLERYFGFYRAMELHGGELNPRNVIRFSTMYGGEAVYFEIKKKLAQLQELPTAFFTDNDIIAIYLMKALKEQKIRVPEDVSVIGFDNTHASEYTEPPLTTIATSKHDLGCCAVNQLVNIMDGLLRGIQKIEIKSKLKVRNSVKELNVRDYGIPE